MVSRPTRLLAVLLIAGIAVAHPPAGRAQPRSLTILAATPAALRSWDTAVDRMLRDGELEVRRTDVDTLIAGRVHTRLQQTYRGVPVFGGEVTRQTDATGATMSLFGSTFQDIAVDAAPTLTADDACDVIERISGVRPGPYAAPVLLIVPTDAGYALAWRASVFSSDGDAEFFIDAHTGAVLQQQGAAQRQSVGVGTGVLGDQKKVSAAATASGFVASDLLRPPALVTLDMKENLQHTLDVLNGLVPITNSDRAASPGNVWTDGAVVDAHTYAGYFYDYYFRRFNRHGLDNSDFRIYSLVHPVPRALAASQPSAVVNEYYANAFWATGPRMMVFGEGLPFTTVAGQRWNYLAGGLDTVAHELTHGITQFTSGLIYQNESGALNESFSDMMGTAVEFFYQPAGSGLLRADYLIGEDVVTPGGIRSMANPAAFGQPDHYSRRLIVPVSNDNGGVHTNSGIPNQVYYLAIEGGTNRTSGLGVQGVGVANRDQIEKVMYRAFTQLMPANATFSVARSATIQAATDLYGGGSSAVRAITQAWTAVGVN